MEGWLKLYRAILNSDMYKALNSKQRDVMITCLLLANHTPNKWEYKGVIYECKAGQMVTSLDKICNSCAKDVSIKNVRTSLAKLEKWGFLANESTKTGRLITIINWHTYQSESNLTGKDIDKGLAKSGQRGGKEVATNKNDKKEKNEKNDKKKTGPTFAKNFLIGKNITWIDQNIWEEWIELKLRRKASISERALNMNIKKLESFGRSSANEVIEKSLSGGYSDLFPLKSGFNNNNNQPIGAEMVPFDEQ